MGHMNYKRVSKRINEELKSTIEIARVTSLMGALHTLLGKIDIQIMVHNGHVEKTWIKKHLLKKHAAMNEYFEKVFGDFSEKYIPDFNPKMLKGDCANSVWLCWWQGLDNAPEIVKRCLQSISENAEGHKVVVITEENLNEYVQFPEWLMGKYKKGIISKTHLSDLLRLELLANYGGVWLDTTFFVTGSLSYCFESPVWTIKRPDYRHTSVACGQFANYSFGCNCENRIVFWILRDYLLEYWKKYDYMIDYLFLDYLIALAIKKDQTVRYAFDKIEPNNPRCDDLLPILGAPYDVNKWLDLKEKTQLFKLTWKADFPKKIGEKYTNYGRLFID